MPMLEPADTGVRLPKVKLRIVIWCCIFVAMKYWPNPSHKVATTVAGPPVWNPNKTKCKSMSLTECQALLDKSLPHSENSRRRWTVQAIGGNYIFFALMSDNTVDEDGNLRFHGYPDDKIPPKVRRQLLAQEGVSASLEQKNNRDSR